MKKKPKKMNGPSKEKKKKNKIMNLATMSRVATIIPVGLQADIKRF